MILYLQIIDTPEDRSKFERLYYEYRGLMFCIANEILKNKQDAEDMVHAAFVSIAENMDKIDAPICPKTKAYAATIVAHKALDMRRRRERHPTIPLDSGIAGTAFDYDTAHTIAECIAALPEQSRYILYLKYRHGYTNKEIASALRISEANAVKRIQRAKDKLDALCREGGVL